MMDKCALWSNEIMVQNRSFEAIENFVWKEEKPVLNNFT